MSMTKDTTQTTANRIPRIICVDRIMNTVIGIPTADVSFEDRQKLERVGFYSVNDLASYFISESGYNAGDRDIRVEFGGKYGLIKQVDPHNAGTELELIQALFGVKKAAKPYIVAISRISHIRITLNSRAFPYIMQKPFGEPVSKAINSILKGEVLLREYIKNDTRTDYTLYDGAVGVVIAASVCLSNGHIGIRDLAKEQTEYREIGERFLQVISEAYNETLSRLQFDQTTEFDYSQVEEGVLA
jgi:hypothetical protein